MGAVEVLSEPIRNGSAPRILLAVNEMSPVRPPTAAAADISKMQGTVFLPFSNPMPIAFQVVMSTGLDWVAYGVVLAIVTTG